MTTWRVERLRTTCEPLTPGLVREAIDRLEAADPYMETWADGWFSSWEQLEQYLSGGKSSRFRHSLT